MNITSIRELYLKYQDWLGATPIKSSSLDTEDEQFVKEYLSARDEKEAKVLLEKMFDKMLEDMPKEFSEDELVAEEDLPYWLRENTEEPLSKPLPELKIDDDEWVLENNNKIATSIHPLVIVFIGVVVLSAVGLLGIVFWGETVLWVSFMVFIPVLVIGIIAGQVANVKDRKAINQTWQKFADSCGLDYEINKDTRRLFGEYQGYMVSVDTQNIGIRGIELQTHIMLLDLRISQDIYIKLSPYNNLDKSRKWFGNQDSSAKGEFEQRFKVITQPKHLAYIISSSTQLCHRLLKIESDQARIEIADKVLYFQQSIPPTRVENWRFLLNTLCIFARTVERAEN